MLAAMSDVVPLRQPERPSDTTAYLGMVIFLGTWAMMFAALFFAYAEVRMRAQVWPPSGEAPLPLLLPGLNTLALAATSLTLGLGLRAVRSARPRTLKRWLVLAFVLGALFLALQCKVWMSVWRAGLRPDSTVYGSVFYALTCFHALHVLVGLVGLLILLRGALAGAYTVSRHAPVRLWAMYWHFVDAVWVLMFATVYVL
jgi:heme/copper-type cytochrome/quinol oxidase subunit 3